jgi:hypothetical protein
MDVSAGFFYYQALSFNLRKIIQRDITGKSWRFFLK